MAEEVKGVETTDVENKSVDAQLQTTSTASMDDPELRLKTLTAELEKTRSERDNYRKGLLARKGKIEDSELDLTDPIQLESYINKTVEDRLLATTEVKAEQELRQYTESLARTNKELKLALANRNVIPSGASSGSGTQAKVEATSPDTYWSPEMVTYLKEKRGLTDEQIKKAAENAKALGA